MTPLPPAANCLRVDIMYGIGVDDHAGSHMFYEYTGGPLTTVSALALASAIEAVAATNLAPLVSSNGSVEKIVVRDLSVAGGAVASSTGGFAGTRSGGELPSSTAALINYAIGRSYRGGKPRNYHVWGTASDVSASGQWAAGMHTDVGTHYGAFLAAMLGVSAGGCALTSHVSISYYQLPNTVIISPTTGRARNVPTRRTTPHVDAIAGYSLNPVPGTQRRRNWAT